MAIRKKLKGRLQNWARARFLRDPQELTASGEMPRRQGLAVTMSILLSCLLWFTYTMQEE